MPNFAFTEYGSKERLNVKVDDQFLCTLQRHYSNDSWKIEKIGSYQDGWDTDNVGFFPTKEIAAHFAYKLAFNVEAIRHSKPLPVDVMTYINQRAKDLKDQKERLSAQMLDLQQERYQLLQLAKTYGVDWAEHLTDDADRDSLLKKLSEVEIVKRKKSIPFFSESALYPLIGKDSARTILGYMRTLADLVSPGQEYL